MDNNAKIKEIKQRFEAARTERTQYANNIDTAFRYSIPQRRIYLNAANKLAPNPEVYDSTAVIGAQRFATKLQSMLVPTAQNWMALTNGSDIVGTENADAKKLQLDDDTDIFFEELQHSNFDTQVAESFQDLSVTTGAILVQPSPIGSMAAVAYKAVPIDELYIENPVDGGTIKTCFREFDIRIDLIEHTYPGSKISEKDAKILDKDPNAKVKVTESTLFRPKTNEYDTSLCSVAESFFYMERTEPSSPWVIFRENVVPGAALGFGRVMRVLPDIKTVNKIKELTLKGGSIAVSGTFMAHDDGVLNPYNVRLRPGGIIPVNTNDQRNPSIARLDTPTNFDWANMEINQLQATINDVLLSNPMGSIETTPVRSATEIAARNRDLFDSVASSFGRLQVEFVAPIIQRTIYVLQQAGRLREDLIVNGKIVSFDFVSPLTRLQQSADIENVLEWLSVVGTMGPEVTNLTVNMDQVPAWLGEQYNVPQELMKNPDEVKQAAQGVVDAERPLPPPGPDGAQMPGAGTELAGGMLPQGAPGVASPGGLDSMY